ncbi:MAG: serine/threonine protein kinase [Labilithrix sp.]|nr:serine/threonine protein kinase [Labilithrix sp.]
MSSAQLEDPFGLVGTTLDGQYRADQVVGEGGYGVVYRGWHASLEQPIAIKALKVMSAENRVVQDALFAKFKDEAKLLYTLSQASLNIVRSMDFGAVTTKAGAWAPYMVLEWLQGRSLADDLAQRRRAGMKGRTLDEALALLEPAAEGLTIAHHRRVAHRDIKPANFFLLDGGDGARNEGPRVKVLDFGIAKIIRDGEGPGTRSPFASFTWLYAAPEQLDPRVGQSGLATDVYSFALLLSELLTDRVPTEGRDVVSLLKAATDPTVRPTPRQRGANVPDAIEVVCRRALAVDPNARYATIEDLWAALSAARRPTLPPSLGGPGSNVPTTKPSLADAPRLTPAPPTPPPHTGPAPGSYSQQAAPVVYPPGAYPPGYPSHGATHPPPQSPPQTGHPVPYAQPPYPSHPMTGVPPGSHGLAQHTAAAMSPPPMSPPPGTARYVQRPRFVPQGPSSLPIVLAVIGLVLGLLFVGTCAAVHAACG